MKLNSQLTPLYLCRWKNGHLWLERPKNPNLRTNSTLTKRMRKKKGRTAVAVAARAAAAAAVHFLSFKISTHRKDSNSILMWCFLWACLCRIKQQQRGGGEQWRFRKVLQWFWKYVQFLWKELQWIWIETKSEEEDEEEEPDDKNPAECGWQVQRRHLPLKLLGLHFSSQEECRVQMFACFFRFLSSSLG